MQNWQQLIILILLSISIFTFGKGIFENIIKKNSFQLTPYLFLLGIFVWGDATVIGLFWIIVSSIALFTQNWILFLLFIAVYWCIRGLGETIYWLNQQFSTITRNPPEKMWLYKFFKNDSVWFIYQIYWQCVTVFSIVATIYLTKLIF